MTPTDAVDRRPLTRARVLAEAVALADEEGLDAVTMRRLGQRLGVEAMSLYNHVANKVDLLDGMADVVSADFAVPAPG
jgi:AcrR family transcriptional regulator